MADELACIYFFSILPTPCPLELYHMLSLCRDSYDSLVLLLALLVLTYCCRSLLSTCFKSLSLFPQSDHQVLHYGHHHVTRTHSD